MMTSKKIYAHNYRYTVVLSLILISILIPYFYHLPRIQKIKNKNTIFVYIKTLLVKYSNERTI